MSKKPKTYTHRAAEEKTEDRVVDKETARNTRQSNVGGSVERTLDYIDDEGRLMVTADWREYLSELVDCVNARLWAAQDDLKKSGHDPVAQECGCALCKVRREKK